MHTFYQNPAEQPLRIFEEFPQSALPDDFLVRGSVLWQKAEAAVQSSPAHSYNVRMGAIPVLNARLARMGKYEEITVWATRNPARFIPLPAQQAIAATLVSRFDEAQNIRLAEGREAHDQKLAQWRRLATPMQAPPPADCATIEDTLLSLGNRGHWGDTVTDPLAEDGSAMKLYNTHHQWCTTLQFRHVAFDEGQKYRLRMRVRVEKKAGQEGEAFWAGVYDAANQNYWGGIERKTSAVGDGYEWYDVAEWTPEVAHYFWIGPGRFDLQGGAKSDIEALYIDKLELRRIE